MKTKNRAEVAHVTRDSIGHHFQGQKVKGQGHRGGSILWRPPAQLVQLTTSWNEVHSIFCSFHQF